MKRFYVIVFLLIAAAACIGLAIAEDAGYVLIAYKNFRYESSVWATLALLALLRYCQDWQLNFAQSYYPP